MCPVQIRKEIMNAVAQQGGPAGTTNGSASFITPDVNIFEDKDGYVLEAEMPGVNKGGLEITLEGNELTLVGRRNSETLKSEILYRESRPTDYRRVFELDPAVDSEKISATMEQGVLTLRLPKTEKVKPRKISIS